MLSPASAQTTKKIHEIGKAGLVLAAPRRDAAVEIEARRQIAEHAADA